MFTKVNELKESFTKEMAATQQAILQLNSKVEQLKGAIYAVDQIMLLEEKGPENKESQLDSQPQLPLENADGKKSKG